MIDGIGKAGGGRLELVRGASDRISAEKVSTVDGDRSGPAGPSTAVGEMAAAGAPVNSDKVAAIRAAIAGGRYPVDPDKIAESMLALDLPLFDGQ